MKVKGLFKKVIAVATVVSVMIFSTIGVYAKYSDLQVIMHTLGTQDFCIR